MWVVDQPDGGRDLSEARYEHDIVGAAGIERWASNGRRSAQVDGAAGMRLCQGRLITKLTKPERKDGPKPRSMRTAEPFRLVGALAFTRDPACFNRVAFIVIDARAGKTLGPD